MGIFSETGRITPPMIGITLERCTVFFASECSEHYLLQHSRRHEENQPSSSLQNREYNKSSCNRLKDSSRVLTSTTQAKRYPFSSLQLLI
ncbi:hypothetical protein PVAP13_5KG230400 [Panicum virgatum]|uniref:Uncharacterized protein n=1 Tax=Panicum virgatum TaxID=38727 RepID=A0A8T0SGS2_PANVG|nr:hypothetical protein PVAP13_5KG230400 [Panicum virgatum]